MSPRQLAHVEHDIPDVLGELQHLLRQIPGGRVTTYGDLGRALGDAKAARWVGEYLLNHPHHAGCPCHRVVRINGDVGLYITGSETEKIALLRRDGVPVDNRSVALDRFRFQDFRSSRPLAALHTLQDSISSQLRLEPFIDAPKSVGGVDVSYISPVEAVAAFVVVEPETGELVWSTTVRAKVTFPYISGYLAFRELPLLARLFEQVRSSAEMPDVLFVDGNGILHPRRAGSACCAGLVAGVPTIGVGKTLLCGRVEHADSKDPHMSRVLHNEEHIGYAIRASPHSRPFYVSPGHLIDLPATWRVTQLMLGDRRLPLPIAGADRVSRREVQRIKSVAQL